MNYFKKIGFSVKDTFYLVKDNIFVILNTLATILIAYVAYQNLGIQNKQAEIMAKQQKLQSHKVEPLIEVTKIDGIKSTGRPPNNYTSRIAVNLINRGPGLVLDPKIGFKIRFETGPKNKLKDKISYVSQEGNKVNRGIAPAIVPLLTKKALDNPRNPILGTGNAIRPGNERKLMAKTYVKLLFPDKSPAAGPLKNTLTKLKKIGVGDIKLRILITFEDVTGNRYAKRIVDEYVHIKNKDVASIIDKTKLIKSPQFKLVNDTQLLKMFNEDWVFPKN